MIKIFNFITLIGIGLLITVSRFSRSQGGFINQQCTVYGLLNAKVMTCRDDCFKQHGADYGICNVNYTCICGPITHDGEKAEDVGCQGDRYSRIRDVYEKLCQIDCQCNHGAESGTCLFKRQICKCGEMAKVSKCPPGYKNVESFVNLLSDLKTNPLFGKWYN